MNGSRLPWIILGSLAAMFVLVMGFVAVLIGTDLLELNQSSTPGDTPSDPTVTPSPMSPGTGVIEGNVWHDLCAAGSENQPLPLPPGCVIGNRGGLVANGTRENDEPGLANIAVRLGQGVCPATGQASQITHGDGYYIFDGLHAGTYCISIDSRSAPNSAQLLPGAWTAPRTSAAQSSVTITIADGERRGAVDFGWDYQFLPVPPTATATPTVTITPTPTLTPTITPVPIPCDWAAYVKDITVPDGTVFTPDKDFRKTWQLKNIGTCTWTKDYALVFVSGDRMTGDNVTKLGKSVPPGQTIDVSIELTAPVEVGKHVGYWALRNSSGKIFGIGPKAQDSFWVQIQVVKPKTIVFNMVSNVCQATWTTGAGEIPCPTDEYSVDGFVQPLDVPVLEGGRVENEPGLWVIPQGVNDGWIEGIYPPFTVKSGDSFRTVVSCWDESPLCNVEFKLRYMNEAGEVKTLGTWVEKYEGSYTKVNIDLSALRGQAVRFILRVSVQDVFDQESSIWLLPSIWR